MSVRAWGQLIIQATMPSEDPVIVGTLWADTSTERLKQCTSVSPYTFVTIGGTGAAGSGDVVGPAVATNNDLAAFDGTTGKLIKDSGILTSAVVQSSRQVISGGGLTGGGDLSADRTLAVGAGTGITVNADDIAATPHALLDGSINSDTLSGSATRGDVIFGNSTPKWARKAVGTGVLAADGTDVTGWTQAPTLTTPSMTAPTVSTSISTPSIITASGALTVTPAAGSNLNVALSTTGDFAVNTNQLYVDTSLGFVGVGTATPIKYVDVKTGTNERFLVRSGTDFGGSYTGTSIDSVNDANNAATMLVIGGSPTVFSRGSVGIGTAAPGSLLHTLSAGDNFLKVQGNNAGSNVGVQITNDASGGKAWSLRSVNDGSLVFRDDTSGNIRATIDTAGNVGIGGTAATSAKLEIASTTGALLIPRMTTTQRDALTAVNGMIIYNSTAAKFQGYEAGAWNNFSVL